jgi:hypothetical protein
MQSNNRRENHQPAPSDQHDNAQHTNTSLSKSRVLFSFLKEMDYLNFELQQSAECSFLNTKYRLEIEGDRWVRAAGAGGS